jgi:hypothetical protein
MLNYTLFYQKNIKVFYFNADIVKKERYFYGNKPRIAYKRRPYE